MINPIIAPVIGDLAGKPFESKSYYQLPDVLNLKPQDTDFTDDTVLTIAVADALLTDMDFTQKIHSYARKYPRRGYGGNFRYWIKSDVPEPYNSFGNGSAMRVSPVAWAAKSFDEALDLAASSAEVTHNHPEGIKGAQAVAGAIYLARTGASKDDIKTFIEGLGYKLNFDIESIRPLFSGDATNQATIPVVAVAFLEGEDFLSAVHKAIYIGGDTDTQAAIVASIAFAYYKHIPQEYVDWAYSFLPDEFVKVMDEFYERFIKS